LREDGLGFTRAEVLALFAEAPLLFDSGTEWLYSNSGYFLLGLIVEEAAQRPYAQVLQERVLTPLKLDHTGLYARERVAPNMATGYMVGPDGKLIHATPLDATTPFSAGAVRGTADDVARLIESLCEPTFEAGLIGRMTLARATLSDGTPTDYDLGGVWDRPLNGHRRIYHAGFYPGFEAHMACLPDIRTSIVILRNVSGAAENPAQLGVKIARLILGIASPVKPVSAPLDPESARRLSGRFWFEDLSQPLRELRLFWNGHEMKAEERTRASRTLRSLSYLGGYEFVRSDDDDTRLAVDVEKRALTINGVDYSLVGHRVD
jgi:CubicO group peptidase (beta-lactamase class C family)